MNIEGQRNAMIREHTWNWFCLLCIDPPRGGTECLPSVKALTFVGRTLLVMCKKNKERRREREYNRKKKHEVDERECLKHSYSITR